MVIQRLTLMPIAATLIPAKHLLTLAGDRPTCKPPALELIFFQLPQIPVQVFFGNVANSKLVAH